MLGLLAKKRRSDNALHDIRIGPPMTGDGFAVEPPVLQVNSTPRRIILVHGFNVHSEGAGADYRALIGELRAVSRPGLVDSVLTLSWPGYVEFGHAVDRSADEVADLFAGFLERSFHTWNGDIVLVGHSLGCRLILEALARLPGGSRLRGRVSVFLMAAAVPTHAVTAPNGRLHEAATTCRRADVFYSTRDKAMHVFRVYPVAGQPFGSRPVGLLGEPETIWRHRTHMWGFDHGDYWRSRDIAYEIARSMGQAERRPRAERSLARRERPSRSLAAWVLSGGFARSSGRR